MTTSAVTIFVILAGAFCTWMFCPNKTAPESASMTMPASDSIPVSEGQSGFANAVIGIPAAISAVIIKLISKRLNLFIRFLPVSFPFPEILLYHERYKLDDPSIL